MIRVAPIKLVAGNSVLWFDPADNNDIHKGTSVVVQTSRGVEFGHAAAEITEVSEEVVEALPSPLKPVLRVASAADELHEAELAVKGEEALVVFKELAAEEEQEMRPVMVDFLFDGERAIFYFEAEQRIDFRDLVRKLAGKFHVRVDMRQIGVRDAARMIGGIGHCGQELCCKRMGGEFSPVSIRMAKEQNLSLNPQKISGCCGRLMCCLRYEYDVYKEVNSRAPKCGATVEVPHGHARVTEVNVPREMVSLALEDGNSIHIPINEMQCSEGSKRPNRVTQEVIDKYTVASPLDMLGSATSFEVTEFSEESPVALVTDEHCSDTPAETSHRKPRRRRQRRSGGTGSASGNGGNSTSSGSDGSNNETKQGAEHLHAAAVPTQEKRTSRSGRRPGQKSSGVRNTQASSQRKQRKPSGRQRNSQTKQPEASKQNGASKQSYNNKKNSGNKPLNTNKQTRSHASGDNRAAHSISEQDQAPIAHRKPRRRRSKQEGTQSNEHK